MKVRIVKKVKESTGFSLTCQCGATAPIFNIGGVRHYAHCPGCGKLTFFSNPLLLERLKFGFGVICPHDPEIRPCKGGATSWCALCRIRCFYKYEDLDQGAEQEAPVEDL